MHFSVLLMLMALLITPDSSSGQYYGRFMGRVQAEWLEDGINMKLLGPLTYIDPGGGEWSAPSGFVTDGASIPWFLWSIVGSPYTGTYRDAAVIHDFAFRQKDRPWELVHLAFYNAMRASGVNPILARMIYGAVYHYCKRWGPTVRVRTGSDDQQLKEADFPELKSLIEQQATSADDEALEEIRNFSPSSQK